MASQASAKGQVSATLRPRLTGMLRGRLYPSERVHFDIDHEAIIRYQALERKAKTGDKSSAKDGFCVQKFVRPEALAGDRHDARQYFNSFLNQCGKIAGDEGDRQSFSEFVYDTTAGKGASMNEDEQYEAIREVVVTFTKQDFSRLKGIAQKLLRYDRWPSTEETTDGRGR
ncbi:unnamed protein product [Effrenium voratum]|nr:unnamed protein product [Effrenium voratum]